MSELILSSYTLNQGRIIINNAFSGQATFNTVTAAGLKSAPIFIVILGADIYWDYSLGSNAYVTVDASMSLNISNLYDGAAGTIFIIQSATAIPIVITLPTGPSIVNLVSNGGGGTISLSSLLTGGIDKLSFVYRIVPPATETFYWHLEKNYN